MTQQNVFVKNYRATDSSNIQRHRAEHISTGKEAHCDPGILNVAISLDIVVILQAGGI